MITVPLLVVGTGLVLAGLAHAALPRALGWRRSTHGDAGPLSALVVRMHVYFLGLFLVVLGALTLAAALTPPGPLATVLELGGVLVFAARSVVEVVAVGPAVRASGSTTFARLHRLGLVAWPLVTVVYLAALVV